MITHSLVTGACGGIGKALCRELALKGENLILFGRNEEKLNALKDELLGVNPSILIILRAVDLSSEVEVQNACSFLKEQSVSISAFYYVSGIDTRKAFVKYDSDKIIRQARVNFESAVTLSKFCLDNRAGELKMLIVSSACGLTPMPYFSLYSATKSALVYFFKGLKTELKGERVKITIVCPGSVPTREDIIEDIKAQGVQGRLSKKSPEYVVKKSLKALDRNKTVFIPGAYNRLVAFISKITPYSIKSRVIAKKFKNKEKDAF
ncbi:MAG: SDR family NAD(P)-dependent oxidoreductase [Clostridia bacterium]|nr:SDR family NAD(P)-dependent oxidoreductase [Clostridia bacterium]